MASSSRSFLAAAEEKFGFCPVVSRPSVTTLTPRITANPNSKRRSEAALSDLMESRPGSSHLESLYGGVDKVRVGFVGWPDGLQPEGEEWDGIVRALIAADLDLLVTNELPFGEWVAARPTFDREVAQRSIGQHATGLQAISRLPIPAVLTSRPVWAGRRLANEAVLVTGGAVHAWRRKQYFPAEPGWFETSWYEPGSDDFPTMVVEGLRAGVLLCTEAMFNERARRYGRAGASLIAIPRATGAAAIWRTAGQMAAIVSGSFVVSSNRKGGKGAFGGEGFAYGPDGTLLGVTSPDEWLAVIDVDPDKANRQQRSYPCYVAERSSLVPSRISVD